MRIVWGLVAALAVMIWGFWPSFFSNPAQNDLLHTVHGTLATGWMLILILQAWLMAKGHVRIHHWVGRLSVLWAAALLVSAVMIMRYGLRATGDASLPLSWRPVLTWLDIISLAMFVGLYIAGIVCAFRRKIDLHYRFMISTVIVIFSPALGRLLVHIVPGMHGLMPALHPTYLILEAVCVALIVYDYVVYKRTWLPYWLALISQVVMEWTMFQAPHIPAFMDFLYGVGLPR